MSIAQFSPVAIDTDHIPTRDRMPFLRDYYARRFIGLDLDPLGEERFRLQANTLALRDLQVGEATTTPLSAMRRPAMLADGLTDICFAIFNRPVRFMVENRFDVVLKAGEGLFYPLSRWWQVEQSDCTVLGMRFSNALLGPMLPDFDRKPFHVVQGANPLLDLFVGYGRMLVQGGTPLDSDQAGLVSRHLAEIAAQILGPQMARNTMLPAPAGAVPGAATTGIASARLAMLRHDVRHHCTDPDFTIADLARRHQVTPRYVQILFDRAGTTFTAFLRDCRLTEAHRLLTSPDGCHLAIGDIAYRAGFSDLSHFNRAFRTRFGAAPRDIRAAAIIRAAQ